MRIVWDEAKRQTNLVKHGLDFADLDERFFQTSVIVPSYSGRWIAINRLGSTVTVAFATLGNEAISVISMRPASRGERKLL